jgi:tetratricopeptide (TPR) repeat protein
MKLLLKPGQKQVPTRSIEKDTSGYLIRALACLLILIFPTSCGGDLSGRDYFHEAEASLAAGNLREAAQLYEFFLEKEKDTSARMQAWERLLLIHLDMKKDVDRGMYILKSMSLETDLDQETLWSVYMRIGRLYVHQGMLEKSVEVLERALEAAGDEERLIMTCESLADSCFKKNDNLTALEVLSFCLEELTAPSAETAGGLIYLLGKACYHQGDQETATHYLRGILYSDAQEDLRSRAGILLYDIYLLENDYDNARQTLSDLESIYPNPMVIKRRLQGMGKDQ